MVLPTIPVSPLLFGSVAIGAAAAILAWRERPNPGATPLVWLLIGQSWWSTCIIFTLAAGTVAEMLMWTRIGWIGVMIIPVAWFLFALEYTGRDEYISQRYVALLLVIPAITAVLALTAGSHDLLYVRQGGITPDGTVIIEQGGVWYAIAAGYTYLLGVLGVVPILGLLSSEASAFRGQSTALLVAIVAPWTTNVLYNLGVVSAAGTDPTPVAFAVSGVAYLGAINRFSMFGANPAPTWRAKQYLFDHIHEGAIVVDEHDTIVEINETGADILGVSVRRALGAPARDIVPMNGSCTARGGTPEFLTIGTDPTARSYDVAVTEVTDRHGRTLGRVLTLHNVTDYLRQQQRLKVLNRVLRHNIRTETSVIHGYADEIGGETAETIKHRALRIVETSEKSRDAIDLFEEATDGRRTRSVTALLESTLARARLAFPDVSFAVEFPGEDAAVSEGFAIVLHNLIENAAEHNAGDDRCVNVTADVVDGQVRVRVADNGPGIDEYELDVLDSGTETPLEHGSGLGLWLVKWGTEIHGGSLSFERNDPRGTVVTATVPSVDVGRSRASTA